MRIKSVWTFVRLTKKVEKETTKESAYIEIFKISKKTSPYILVN
jgi:hypothetical protein